MGIVLQWRGKEKAPEFEDYEILVADPAGGAHKEMKLRVNPCIQTIDAKSTPVVYLNDLNITDNILGVVSCSINQESIDDPWEECAYILTVEGMIFVRGIHRWNDAPNGFDGNNLPIWHLQQAADINCGEVTEILKESARDCMKKLKSYCDYVYQNEPKAYDYNAGLIV